MPGVPGVFWSEVLMETEEVPLSRLSGSIVWAIEGEVDGDYGEGEWFQVAVSSLIYFPTVLRWKTGCVW